jgi:hypothetical protein
MIIITHESYDPVIFMILLIIYHLILFGGNDISAYLLDVTIISLNTQLHVLMLSEPLLGERHRATCCMAILATQQSSCLFLHKERPQGNLEGESETEGCEETHCNRCSNFVYYIRIHALRRLRVHTPQHNTNRNNSRYVKSVNKMKSHGLIESVSK